MAGIEYLSELIGVPVDQTRYFVLLLLSFPLAFLFRHGFHHGHTSITIRYLYNAIIGIGFGIYCFGIMQMIILVTVIGVAYVMLLSLPVTTVHWVTLAYALIVVLGAHSYRMTMHYGDWMLDFTGPLMIIVQRISYVAFELHDGVARKDEELNDDQRTIKIEQIPTILEYTSYNFSFVNFLAGPSCSFHDYKQYITGDNVRLLDNPNVYAKAKEHSHEPSSIVPVIVKCIEAFVCLGIYLYGGYYFTETRVLDSTLSFSLRTVCIYLFMVRMRCLYYFSFSITESICNTAGLGFCGYDAQGNAKWDLVKNGDPIRVEFATNFRGVIQNWNIQTATWLRRCVYERLHFAPTFMTFIVSATWHGLYPGYHFSFAMFSMITISARKVRHLLHHRFQKPRHIKLMYDIATTAATCIWRDFAGISFLLLTLNKTLTIWRYYYFLPLIICFGMMLLPEKKRGRSQHDSGKKAESVKPHSS